MASENLPIFKASMALAVYMEQIVKGFSKYHKYTMGQDLRLQSKKLIFLVSHANNSRDKTEVVKKLRDACEEMKVLIYLSKELEVFHSFKQFEHSSLLLLSICKQAQAWLGSLKR